MKQIISLFAIAAITLPAFTACAQDKSKRPSPPAKETVTTTKGTTITIDYSQPSVKGRTLGKDIAPYGEVWRTGANESTKFEIDKDVTIAGKKLPAGKYGLYTIPGEKEWTVIFNKKSDLWGSGGYSQGEDALRIVRPAAKAPSFTEQMKFTVDKSGLVTWMWGNAKVDFTVE